MPVSHLPHVQRLFNGAPILTPNETHPWENRVTFNPACAFVSDRKELDLLIPSLPFGAATRRRLQEQPGLCFLLYRAQGAKTPSFDYNRSSVGLAVLSPELALLARHDEPVLLPDHAYDNLGVEDGRITRIGNRWYLVYTAYGSGQPENAIRIALASSTDFVHWEKHGLLKGSLNQIDNKNGMIFEGTIGGKYLMLHRPMTGPDAMTVHWAESGNILGEWKSRGVLMRPIPNPEFRDVWTGGGAPPLRLPDGRYLIIYHIGNRKVNGDKEYDLGIALADPAGSNFIVKRDEPLLRPTSTAEQVADPVLGVGNVLFICGAYFYDGDLYFPYAGADSVVLGAKIDRLEIERYCN